MRQMDYIIGHKSFDCFNVIKLVMSIYKMRKNNHYI